ncbi:MAG: PQQ-binding-like beta-propeller repeat protein, partial [Planctomycetaceae bacterium]|nr:PQQ-binding-like beta-propeller repeat protein [Planctomycetaceae bacterium]
MAAQLEEMKFEEPTAAAHPHGDLQTLSELLVIARDRDRQLQVLEENLQANGNNSTGGADRPFLGPDSLSIDSETGEIKGHYAWQVRLLRNASPSVRQAWDRRWSTNATVALNQAVARRDAGAILSVARSYPLTSAGFEAAQLLMALLIEKGQVQQASILLRTCESVYGAIPPFERRMAALRRAMQEVMRRHGNGSAYGQRYANAELFPTVSETDSPPWPEPVWTWRGDNLLSSVPGISSGTHVSFCNWQPIISGDRVLVRSPKKLAALDRSTGEVLWSVRCDVQSENTEMTTRSRPRLSIDETIHFDDPLMSRAAFGNFTCDGQFVYFIDGFDASNRRDQYSNSPRNADPFGQLRLQLGGQQRLQLINPGGQDFPSDLNERRGMGIRLVAVQLDAELRSNPIAWILGDQSFQYRFDSGGTEHPGEGDLREKVEDDRRDAVQATGTEDVHSGTATNPFDGHSFLSSPVGYESRLFLLSTLNANQLLSCVERTTGELIWQQPLVYHESEPLAGVTDMSAAQTASSLHTWNDDVVCSLWNGIIVSCRQSDGALNWATCVVNDDLGIAATRQRLLDADQDSGIGFFSTLHGDLMVASSPGSALVSCVNVADGHLLWQAPRTNSQTKGADDHYVAGITDGNVVLVGSQHCRSLDLQSGMEIWTAEVIPSTGRAWCTGDLCLIPESNGRIAQVRVSDGTVYRCDPRVLPGGLPHISGTVTGDDQYVYVSDTVQVSAFLRNDVLLQRMEKREAAQPTLTDFLKYARSLVLGDKTHEAIRLAIRTLDSQPSAQPEESQQRVREALETFAAELILSTAYESFVNRDSTSDQTDLAVDEVIGYLDWLRHVRLARQHSVLFHLLAVAYGVEELDLSRMQKNGRWFRDNVTMTESWQISPMLVANAIE